MIPKEAIEAGARAVDVPDHKAEQIITAAYAAMSEPVAYAVRNEHGEIVGTDITIKDARLNADWDGDTIIPLYAAPHPAAVKVKPLEWYDTTERNAYGQFLRMAVTVFGSYRILRGSQGKFEVYFGTSPFSGAMDALEKAEDWGQSNYEARILSTLMSAPDLASENERLRAALERQGDNMAFVINHATLPGQWLIKFEAELLEDRAALERT